jgi:5-methylcytosine-specific restriction enzyme B
VDHNQVFSIANWGDQGHPDRFRDWFREITGFTLQSTQFRYKDDPPVKFSIAVRVSKKSDRLRVDNEGESFKSKVGAGSMFISLIGSWNDEQMKEEDLGARYLGTSLVFFPCYRQTDGETRRTAEKTYDVSPSGLVVCMGMGTGGAGPDESLVRNPGHVRRFSGMVASLESATESVPIWWRDKPLERLPIPESLIAKARTVMDAEPFAMYPRDESGGYGQYLYALAVLAFDETGNLDEHAIRILCAFSEFYLRERGWCKETSADPARAWYSKLYPSAKADDIQRLLEKHRFVILCGPPGTRKTQLLQEIAADFGDRCRSVQFHPSVSYQSFVGGIQPTIKVAGASVGFEYSPGPFLRAVEKAEQSTGKRVLLAIDEINRADLAMVLGEAIQMLEPTAKYRLAVKDYNDGQPIEMPENLLVLATMNTADRNIAHLDVAIRRRFAFIRVWPEEPTGGESCDKGRALFTKCRNLFLECGEAADQDLMPGGFYFLGRDAAGVRENVRRRLLPLLEDYLLENRLTPTLQAELALLVQELQRDCA